MMSRAAGLVGQYNLPEDLSLLIGRERDQVQVSGLIAAQRVVSLVGVGGVGKTRLALAVTRAGTDRRSGWIWLVELGSATDSRLVTNSVAEAVGIAMQPRQPAIDALIATLGSKRVHLVVDNCEHLIQACAELVERLVRACSHVRVLVTSREPLRVPGEIAWRVASAISQRCR